MIEIEVSQGTYKRAADLPSQYSIKEVLNADYVIETTDDYDIYLVTTGDADRTIYLSTVADNAGHKIQIMKVDDGTGKVIVDGNGGKTIILNGAEYTTVDLNCKSSNITIICDGTNWWEVQTTINGDVPEGSIIAWLPGYFTNGSNGGYTGISIPLSDSWKKCDGALFNDPSSRIFNGTGRYLPNITDDRFLMGDTAGSRGGTGGSSTMAHTHPGPSHRHTGPNHTHTLSSNGCALIYPNNDGQMYLKQNATDFTADRYASPFDNLVNGSWAAGGSTTLGGATDLGGTGNTGLAGDDDTGAASNDENKPKYLSVSYIMKVRA